MLGTNNGFKLALANDRSLNMWMQRQINILSGETLRFVYPLIERCVGMIVLCVLCVLLMWSSAEAAQVTSEQSETPSKDLTEWSLADLMAYDLQGLDVMGAHTLLLSLLPNLANHDLIPKPPCPL